MNLNDCLKHTENINKYHDNILNKFNNIQTILEQNRLTLNNNIQHAYYSIKHNESTLKYHHLITQLIDTHYNATIETINNITKHVEPCNLFDTLPKIEKYMTKDKKIKTVISYGKSKTITNREEIKTPPPNYSARTPQLLYYIQPSYIYQLPNLQSNTVREEKQSIPHVLSPKTPRRNRNDCVII
jgi:hypothetical protein